MPIIHHRYESDFSIVPNSIYNDKRLNLRDIGLLTYLLHLPDSWQFSVEGLASVLPNDGRDGITASLKRIEQAGYLKRERGRADRGKLGNAIWTISDSPITAFPVQAKPVQANPAQEKPRQIKNVSNKEQNKKELTYGGEFSEDSRKAAMWIEKQIKKRHPDEPEFLDTEREEWAWSLEQIKNDGFTREQINDVIVWWQEDSWLRSHINDGKSLRRNFRKLFERMEEEYEQEEKQSSRWDRFV